jgi:SM-20-related protein
MIYSHPIVGPGTIARVVDMIATRGYAVAPEFLDRTVAAALRANALRFDRAGSLLPAAVGHGADRVERADVRGDRIRWLEETTADVGEQSLHDALEALRLAANRQLQLGLFEFEGHYSIYPAGAGYARHIDCFRDDDGRVLSIVLYLNDRWRNEDGGVLRLHLARGRSIDAVPYEGTLVAFLSDRFAHEVLPAGRERLSIAGWFRRRA